MEKPSIKQYRMAQVMGLNPNQPEAWPMDKVNEMIHVDETQGFKEVYRRLEQMYGQKG